MATIKANTTKSNIVATTIPDNFVKAGIVVSSSGNNLVIANIREAIVVGLEIYNPSEIRYTKKINPYSDIV